MIIDFATDDLRRAIKELSGSTGGDASELAPVPALPTSAETGTVVALYKEEVPLPEQIRFEERNDLGDNNDKTGGRFYFPFRCGEGYTSGNPLYIGSVSTDDEHSYDITLYALDDPDFTYIKVSGFTSVVNGYGVTDNSFSRDGLTFYSHEPENFGDDGILDFYPTTTGSVSFVLNESAEQLGVYQYDGTTWNEIGSNGGTDKLSALSAFPTSAETGDVVAVNIEGQGLPNGILFEERNDLGDNNDKSGGRFQFPIDGFADATQENPLLFGSMTAPDNTNYDMYLYQDEWSLTLVLSTDGDMYDPNFALSMSVGSDMAGYNMYSDMVMNYHYTESTDEYYVVDIFPETTGSVSFDLDITEGQMGVYQYDGTDWNQLGTGGSGGSQNYIILDDLTGTGEEGQLYSYHNRLYRWVNGAGRWGKWIIGYDNNSDMYSWGAGNNTAYSHLVYSYLPFTADTWLCQIKILNNIRYIAYHYATNELYVYSSQDFSSTPVATISMNGQEVQVAVSGRDMYISWVEGCITFRQVSSWSQMQSGSYADTAVSTAHFEAFDVDYFKGKTAFDKNSGIGVVLSNSEGVAQFTAGLGTTQIFFNTTGYNSYIKAYHAYSNNVPSRIFVPTQGGTAGQMLISSGDNAEPTWTNWIKSVQITSAEYEALVTKDPNTLYLIVDE